MRIEYLVAHVTLICRTENERPSFIFHVRISTSPYLLAMNVVLNYHRVTGKDKLLKRQNRHVRHNLDVHAWIRLR